MSKLTQIPALLAAAFLGLSAANAASPASQAQQQYQQERAVCMSGKSNQDRATCLKEAGAALSEAKRARLDTDGQSSMETNRLQRCANLPRQDRRDCLARMQRGTTSGSAQQGGIIREVRQPAPAR